MKQNKQEFITRKLVAKVELKRQFLKAESMANRITESNKILMKIHMKLNNLPKKSSVVRLRNQCFLTGRSNGIFKKFKISRLMVKNLVRDNKILGLSKASW
jgi:ribosomal protein S14